MKPHLLAARLDSAGDVLLMGPAVRALAAGSRKLTMLCGPRGFDAARLLPGVTEILVHKAPWIDPEPGPLEIEATLTLVKEISSREIDQAVIFTSFHQSPLPLALLLRMAGVGTVAAISEDYPGSLLDVRHRVADDIHEVERALSLAAAAGYTLPEGDDGRLQIHAPSRRPQVSHFGIPSPYVVVHPGASVPARAWAPDRHRALVAALAARDLNVAVSGGPFEVELTALVSGKPPSQEGAPAPGAESGGLVFNLGGKLSFSDLALLLRGAEAAVVANTGPAHLAAAVGTPVVSLFAPTVPASRWRPWKVRHILLGRHDIACAGCRAKQCPVAGHPCLDEVSVEEVEDALDRVTKG